MFNLNTLLDDIQYKAMLLSICDELDMQYDYFTSLSEVIRDEPNDFSVHSIERDIARAYPGGIAQMIRDDEPVSIK